MSAKHKHVTSYTIDLTYESKQEGIEAYRREIAKLEYGFHCDFPNVSLYSPNEEIEVLVKDKSLITKEKVFEFYKFLLWYNEYYGIVGYFTIKWEFFEFLQQFHFTIHPIAWEAFINYTKYYEK